MIGHTMKADRRGKPAVSRKPELNVVSAVQTNATARASSWILRPISSMAFTRRTIETAIAIMGITGSNARAILATPSGMDRTSELETTTHKMYTTMTTANSIRKRLGDMTLSISKVCFTLGMINYHVKAALH